jgi:hypothetical protein
MSGAFTLLRGDAVRMSVNGVKMLKLVAISAGAATFELGTSTFPLRTGESKSVDLTLDEKADVRVTAQDVGLNAKVLVELLSTTSGSPVIVTESGDVVEVVSAVDSTAPGVEGPTLVVDLGKTDEAVAITKSNVALMWLLIVAVMLGILLSFYGVHAYKARKHLQTSNGNVLADYIAKMRKLKHTDQEIHDALVTHGYTEEQAQAALAPQRMMA